MTETLRKWLYDPMVGKIVFTIVGLLILGAVVRLVQKALAHRIEQSKSRYFVRKLVNSGGYLAAVLFITIVFSDQLGHLTVAFGVAGAGIAFASQEVIVSVAGWIDISLGHFYHVGDRVQLGGIMGDVIDIGVLRTTLMECGQWVNADLYNGRIVRVANSFVFKEPVFNYSADFPFLWDEINVPVKYGSDYRLAREMLQRVADALVGEHTAHAKARWQALVHKFMIEDERVDPTVTMIANDNWIEFTLRYVVDYKRRRAVKDELFLRILEELDKTDGRVAIASATFHLVQTPVLDVRLDRGLDRPGDGRRVREGQLSG
jgi:small-conductance mechanosensitive channel